MPIANTFLGILFVVVDSTSLNFAINTNNKHTTRSMLVQVFVGCVMLQDQQSCKPLGVQMGLCGHGEKNPRIVKLGGRGDQNRNRPTF